MWGFGFYTKTYLFGNNQSRALLTYIHSDDVHVGVNGYVIGLVCPLSTWEINTGTKKVFLFFFFFFYDYSKYFNHHLLQNKGDYRLAGWLTLLPVFTQQHNQPFKRRIVCLSSKKKSIDTANALCVCEDINLNILPEWLGGVWQISSNSEQSSFQKRRIPVLMADFCHFLLFLIYWQN